MGRLKKQVTRTGLRPQIDAENPAVYDSHGIRTMGQKLLLRRGLNTLWHGTVEVMVDVRKEASKIFEQWCVHCLAMS